MPRPLRLIAVLIAATAGTATAQTRGGECPAPHLRVAERPPGILELTLDAPCAPYTPVTLDYGAFEIAEETGPQGGLTVSLPRLQDGGSVVLALPGGTVTASPPAPQTPPPDFVAILWPGGQAGLRPRPGLDRRLPTLDRLAAGFPLTATTPLAEILVAAPGSMPPVTLEIPLNAAQCGRAVAGALLTSETPQPQSLRLTLPDCGTAGGVLSLPLSP